MNLMKQVDGSWQYALTQPEADILNDLLEKFPFTDSFPVKISNQDADPQTTERNRLLNESLAEHRKELKKLAMEMVEGKFERTGKKIVMTLSGEEREMLLQILNDIRVGCWHALGEPDTSMPQDHEYSAQEVAYHHLMDISGYFEHSLIQSV